MQTQRWNAGCSGASTNKGVSVEEPLKHLMQELGNAINDSLSESDRIAEAIGEIKRPVTTFPGSGGDDRFQPQGRERRGEEEDEPR